MEMKKFVEKVKRAITDRMGEGYRIEVQEVQKNNGVILQGLLIHAKEQNVSPTIYLNSFEEAYERGIPFAVIIEKILRIYEDDTPKENVDMSFFRDFEQVKDKICYRLISAEQNRELLQKIPYVEYLDLAICFYYAYQGDALGNGSIMIHNSHMEMWKTNIDTLYVLAQTNTPRLFPAEWNPMEDIIREMLEEQHEKGIDEFLTEEEQEEFFDQLPMQILSNSNRVHGAACMIYPGLLELQAQREGYNLYIIPSSIHELIILPDSGRESAKRLQEMIVEVNSTQVEPEDILSNNLYYFNRLTGQVKIV